MDEIFSRKWIIATIATWAVIIGLDELAYFWWRKLNPGSQWSGIIVKHPTQTWQDSGGTGGNNGYPNGYRPAGAG